MKTYSSSKLGMFLKSLVALLAGAFVPALIVALFFILSLAQTQASDPDAPANAGAYLTYLLTSGATAFMFAMFFTAAFAFILGLPVALIMIRFRLVRWWSSILAGFLIGFLPSLWASWPDYLGAMTLGGVGAIGGLTSWLVWHFWAGRAAAQKASISVEPAADPPVSI